MRVAVSVYCVVVGALMVGMWVVSLQGGAWSRGDRTHGELALHLTAEFVTAAWLIAAGIALLVVGAAAVPFTAVGLGLLLYTLIVSPGYFLARREFGPVLLFVILTALTLVSIARVLTGV